MIDSYLGLPSVGGYDQVLLLCAFVEFQVPRRCAVDPASSNVRVLKVGTNQRRAAEVRPAKVRPAEVRPAEVRAVEDRMAEDPIAEVWCDIKMFLPPTVPVINALFQNREVFRVCHQSIVAGDALGFQLACFISLITG